LRANLTRASAEVTRTQRLKSSGSVSEREVDTTTGSKGATEGELVAAKAQLEKAQLDLQFTRVTAPSVTDPLAGFGALPLAHVPQLARNWGQVSSRCLPADP
jgi:multidrug efflux pump subunit AcrA (membrane-fusion protein)